MSNSRVAYSPIAVQRMQQYRARMARLVKDGHLEEQEASVRCAREMQRILDRIAPVADSPT